MISTHNKFYIRRFMEKNKQTDLIVFLADKSKRDVSFKINYRAEAILNLIIITVYSIEDFWTIIKLCVCWNAHFRFSKINRMEKLHNLEIRIEIKDYDCDLLSMTDDDDFKEGIE